MGTARSTFRALPALAAAALGLALCCATPARAAMPAPDRAMLTAFLQALHAQNYAAAFADLSPAERAYFRTPANYASGYLVDKARIDSFQIVGSTVRDGVTIAVVSERLQFFSHKEQASGVVTVKVPYGIVRTAGRLGIKDPYHPWRAIAPDWTASANGVTVFVRKISFFTGRVEFLLTFENRGTQTVTILPYGRSVVRDAAGGVHRPIETKLPGLTDPELYEGVRLAPSARFTGSMAFFTADRFTPSSLSATIEPLLADGADAPFALDLPRFVIEH